MPEATFHFPKGFLWGCATASHQVEGQNTNNNWSAWEQREGKIRNGDTAGLACDWWGGRWREDFDRAAETGQNAQRISVEWSRIQPAPDRWDEEALERYRAMLRGLHERKMTPLVTLHHFSEPLWLSEIGGWESDEAPALFAAFVRKTVDALKEYCTLWITINEPNVFAVSAYLFGEFPPGKKDMGAMVRVMANLLKGHALAYKIIHEIQKEARVGVAIHLRSFWPAGPVKFLDRIPAKIMNQAFNTAFMDALVDGKLRMVVKTVNVPEAAGTQDFIGVNYYTVEMVRFNLFKPGGLFRDGFYDPQATLSGTGFIANMPQGLGQWLKWAGKFNLPVMVTENGVEDAEDRMRPQYLVEHIHQVWRASNFVAQVKGYFHWSLVDNFEWERGWSQRFGLWGLDPATQMRIRRPSVDLYAAICKQNALTYEMVAKYAPASLPKIFPG